MNFLLELVVQAVVNDFVSRFVSRFCSYLLDKNSNQKAVRKKNFNQKAVRKKNFNQKGVRKNLEKMEQLLLMMKATVEKAQSQKITERGLLQWFNKIVESMYEGTYVLDTFKCQPALKEEATCTTSSFSSANAKTNRFVSDEQIKELSTVLKRLKMHAKNLPEFKELLLMGSFPTLLRRPYDTDLYLDNCTMFGRRIERERLTNFLLQPEPPSASHWGVLPIVGPWRIGKTTLVEHVCEDERVRDHFTLIITIFGMDMCHSETLMNLHDEAISGRTLIIIEDILDEHVPILNDILYSSVRFLPSGSKFILISRLQGILSLGTVEPIKLQKLPTQEFWYYFKASSFGSNNPDDLPTLVLIAWSLAMEVEGSLVPVKVDCRMLRSKLDAQVWQAVLSGLKQLKDVPKTRTMAPGEPFEIEMWKSPIARDDDYTIVCERDKPRLS